MFELKHTPTATDEALARRIAELVGYEMRKALHEDRLIRTGQMPEWKSGR